MVRHMGLRDLGVYYDNLALARPTWMPAVLCEGAFIIIPEQEAALRTPEFQTAYARGIVDGLESYFRSLAAAR
jgi:N-acetylmuramoyl-L-alanine amidase